MGVCLSHGYPSQPSMFQMELSHISAKNQDASTIGLRHSTGNSRLSVTTHAMRNPRHSNRSFMVISTNDRMVLKKTWDSIDNAKDRCISGALVKIVLRSQSIRKSLGVQQMPTVEKTEEQPIIQDHSKSIVKFVDCLINFLAVGGENDKEAVSLCYQIGVKHKKVDRLAWGMDSFQIFTSEICNAVMNYQPFDNNEKRSEAVQVWEKFMLNVITEMRLALYQRHSRQRNSFLVATSRTATH